jgi:hypothetical protein
MKEIKKFKSNHEALLVCSEAVTKCPVAYCSDARLVSTVELNKETNSYIRKSEYKKIDRVKEMENYRVSDFSLSNLLAIGANIENVGSLSGSSFGIVEQFEKQLNELDNNN